ncbi:hypothetical protein BpHYR1_052428 [Brachionus plicatilis]|uniref:Uncharacterized protein n=1 Tax=Brachionus plicatilis TaxID=10195 RepID=A0A3M7QZT1_BRAPC|nr:hypothetical protein BpHYR1_052428 [Brachionus plicatilis]
MNNKSFVKISGLFEGFRHEFDLKIFERKNKNLKIKKLKKIFIKKKISAVYETYFFSSYFTIEGDLEKQLFADKPEHILTLRKKLEKEEEELAVFIVESERIKSSSIMFDAISNRLSGWSENEHEQLIQLEAARLIIPFTDKKN